MISRDLTRREVSIIEKHDKLIFNTCVLFDNINMINDIVKFPINYF